MVPDAINLLDPTELLEPKRLVQSLEVPTANMLGSASPSLYSVGSAYRSGT